MVKKLLVGMFWMCTVFLLLASGQQNTGTLSGKVTAPDGKPVPSASVTVTSASGEARSAISGQDGAFTINDLQPGSYRVDVEVPGYKRLSQENVQVAAGTPVSVQLGMQAGNTNETVQVQGQAALGDDRDAQMAHGYSGNVMQQLPVYDLNHQQLVELETGINTVQIAPGADMTTGFNTPPGETSVTSNQASNNQYSSILINPQMSRAWNTNGQNTEENITRVDGLLDYDPVLGMETHVQPVFGIQQMNVMTSNYTPDTGWVGGAAINTLTRPGTNSIHGDLFEYNATDWTRARDYFNPKGTKQADLTSNRFGGDVGAPIVKNKTFVFLDYEGDYLRDQVPTWSNVPTAQMIGGNFSAVPGVTLANPFTGTAATGAGRTVFANNVIPTALINPAASRILSALPAPNSTGLLYNYFSNAPVVNDGNRADVRLDQHFSDKASAFLRYGLTYYDTDMYSPLGNLGADAGQSRLRGDNAAAGWTQTFGPTTFMSLRLGYDRYSDPIGALNTPAAAGSYGVAGSYLPEISIGGMSPIGTNPNYPQINKEQTFEAANDWHARFFNQDLRFGVDAWWVRMDGFENMLFGPSGGYTFTGGPTMLPGATIGPYSDYANSVAAFLMGAPTTSGVISSRYIPSYLDQEYGGYLEDRVQLKRLTLDLGVRYDFFRPIQPRNNPSLYSVFDPATAQLTPLGTNGIDRFGNVASNTLNFAPRIGAAYRITDRFVARAGYAMSYFNPSMLFGASALIPQMAYAESGVAGGYAATTPFGALPSTTGTNGRAPDATYYFSPRQVRTPYVEMYNFDLQGDFSHGVMADIAYVGNQGHHLPFTQDMNAALPGTGMAGMAYSGYGITSPVFERGTGFNSNYNSLQVNLTKRFSQGISFAAAYTWSKALDNGAGLMPFLNNSDPFANYGPANFDQTNMFTLSHNIRIPIGAGTAYLNQGMLGKILGPWELDGIFRYATGLPYTPTSSAAMCNCPGNTPTADVNPGPTLVGTGFFPGYFGFFPYQFYVPTQTVSQPGAGLFGNIGRNSFRAPGFSNYDLALTRSFVFMEQTRLVFRAEAYNLLNSAHFAMPVTNVNAASFGESTATMPGFGPRTMQFSLQLVF